MDEKDIIIDMYRRYWQYMIEKNTDGLLSLMSKDYKLTHMTGVVQSREDFIRGLVIGTFNYYSADHDEIAVTVDGDKAVMTAKSRVLAAVYGGNKHSWRLRGDFTLKKENGIWRFTSSSASTY